MAQLETWIGLRYLRAKKRNGFVSFISLISVAGIALGVMALIVVLSVMNGFQKEIRGQLLSVAPHMEIGYFDEGGGRPWQDLQTMVKNNPAVVASAPYVADQALLANSGEMRGVQLRGVDPAQESAVVDYAKNVEGGQLADLREGEFNIILGKDLAMLLGVMVGEKVTVITPEGNVTPAGVTPRLKQFNVVGVVQTKMFEVDSTLAMVNLQDAQVLYRMGDAVSGVRLKLADPATAPEQLDTIIPVAEQNMVWARDWTYQNRSYFEAVELEKKMMTIILSCIVIVAAFNLVSSLVMAVNEKQADIAILRTLGMSPASIMKIFMVQGAIAGFFGTLFGVVGGVVIGLNIGKMVHFYEQLTGTRLINAQTYFIDYLPSDVRMSDVLIIVAISLLMSFLATLYPSWSAARTQPAEALRYE
ncbi:MULTISPECIES: lipoprotein-releasing ABC transporter permease subunit [Vitreoscilla]|uniref:Lipoprotein-releasing ABC transporter permease subunit n=1 Tax=Vitreoscilla stercoraria TaxID=61 RepID=A0ABY4E9I4_VITST|nr:MULTISPECIES: lipoprotein-releasing ABC transporter permease subunit [Vitreoscilla]AUZ04174.2 lipoprotein-releasing system transmembrane protein LolC [Vitreoscilla sp. C1]UOO92060.1 lipoprotein-releasing ABC transporter permease subunit [Vitreoscilla stercoraria]